MTVLDHVELRDPETSQTLGHFDKVEVILRDGTLLLRTSGSEVSAELFRPAWRWTDRTLRKVSASSRRPVRWFAAQLVLRHDDATLTLTDVHGGTTFTPTASQAYVRFLPAAAGEEEPVTLRVIRNREHQRPTTYLEWQASRTDFPCQMFRPLVDATEWLGPHAQFRGYVWATRLPDGWDAELTGQLSQIDLHHAVTRHFPHQLSGTATLRLERAIVRSGRLVEVSGSFQADGGMVSRSLLESASRSLRMGWGVPDNAQGVLPYDQIAMGFSLDQGGVELTGNCSQAPGAIVLGQRHILLQQPHGRQPVAALIRTLVPHREVQVPASREAQWLVARLPLARVIAPFNTAAPPSSEEEK